MSPQRAHTLGVRADDCRNTSESNRYGGAWLVWVPDERRSDGMHVLTQAVTPFSTCQWIAQLRRLEAAGN